MNGQTTLSPAQVVTESAQVLSSSGVDASLAYFSDDAVYKLVGLPPGQPDTFAGKEQLRAWMKELMADHFELEVRVVKADDDTVTTETLTWSDMTRNLGVVPLVATEVYVVKDGKIASATWTLTPESQAKFMKAVSAQT